MTEAPANADLAGARRWEEFRGEGEPVFVPRERKDTACIVYSSGTGGRPKGCMMTHENYLEQCVALTSLYPFWPGVRYLSILPTNHAIDFMVGFFGPFTCGATVVHLRTLRPEYVREAFPKYKITYVSLVPLVLKNLQKGLQARFDALPAGKRKVFNAFVAINKALTKSRPRPGISRRLLKQVHEAFGGELTRHHCGRRVYGAANAAVFLRPGNSGREWLRPYRSRHSDHRQRLRPFRADTVGKPLPGMEVRIVNPAVDGVGEVSVRSKTVMAGYLNEPELKRRFGVARLPLVDISAALSWRGWPHALRDRAARELRNSPELTAFLKRALGKPLSREENCGVLRARQGGANRSHLPGFGSRSSCVRQS